MDREQAPRVLLVPGSVTPASISYAPLLAALGASAQVLTKELEIYAGETPPAGFGLDLEVDGIQRVADDCAWRTFHLVGFSAGGAASLAFAARYPQRLLSLALIEPAWIGNGEWSPEETAHQQKTDSIMALPAGERLAAFMRNALRPGVEFAGPPGPPPAWMAKRPAGIAAFREAFKQYDLDLARLRSFQQPVYLAIGTLSNVVEERKAERLGRYLEHLRVDVYEGLHHFNPPQRAEPARLATALRTLWAAAAPIEG
jgi:pimeloyl-ACP methyl ester carboxylesterase